jgi:gluconate 2-dehydrogenase alpha chain
MATEKTDGVIVGVGAAGAVIAAELAKAGMKVIGLERGPRLSTADFRPPDEVRFFQRHDLRPIPKRQPVLAGSGETHQPPPTGFATAREEGRKRP